MSKRNIAYIKMFGDLEHSCVHVTVIFSTRRFGDTRSSMGHGYFYRYRIFSPPTFKKNIRVFSSQTKARAGCRPYCKKKGGSGARDVERRVRTNKCTTRGVVAL